LFDCVKRYIPALLKFSSLSLDPFQMDVSEYKPPSALLWSAWAALCLVTTFIANTCFGHQTFHGKHSLSLVGNLTHLQVDVAASAAAAGTAAKLQRPTTPQKPCAPPTTALPQPMMLEVFSFLNPYTLTVTAQVSRNWADLLSSSSSLTDETVWKKQFCRIFGAAHPHAPVGLSSHCAFAGTWKQTLFEQLHARPKQLRKYYCARGGLCLLIHGNLYDIAALLETHPGGAAVLLESARCNDGDCTQEVSLAILIYSSCRSSLKIFELSVQLSSYCAFASNADSCTHNAWLEVRTSLTLMYCSL
jgi:F-box domain